MKLIAFAASSSRHSINKQLATHAAQVMQADISPDAEIEILDLNNYEMPIYSIDRENDPGIPALAQQFFDKIGSADALVVSFASHNGSYTAAYKNIFDWASRIDTNVFQGKPIVMLSTSTGASGAKSVLENACLSASHFKADLRGSLSVPSFHDNFDTEAQSLKSGVFSDELSVELRKLLD